MEIIYADKAKADIEFWKKSGNVAVQRKIIKLISSIEEDPYLGIGKPEQLKHNLSGFWSRRINKEHRLVYKVNEEENRIEILTLKGHY